MFDIVGAVDVNIYRYNGFRLLDLPITASGKKVKKNFRKIEAKYKMSENEDITLKRNILMPISPSPKFNNYQKANSRLNDAKVRFIDEIFWFWPSNLIKDDDTVAWEYLRNKQYDDFIQYWENKNDKNVSYHNLAVFYQARALDFYASNENTDKIIEYSEKALDYWKKTFTSGFEEFVKDRVKKLNNPLLKESFVNKVFSELQKAILSIYLDITQNAIKSNNLNDVHKYIDLINDSGFDFNVITNVINNLLTFLIYQIDSEIKDFRLSINDLNKTEYLQLIIHAKSYTVTVSPLLDILSIIAPRNIKAKDAINKANSVLQDSLVKPFNSLLEDYSLSYKLNFLYVSLLDIIAEHYGNFEISYRSRELLENNSQISKNRISYLETFVFSSSDKAATGILCSFVKDELRKGLKLDNVSNKMKLIKSSRASEEILDVCLEILTDSFNNCVRGEDKVTQILYRQNLSMLKYETILEGV